MPLSDDKRIVDLLTDMLFEMKGFREELKEVKHEITGLKIEMTSVKEEVSSLKDQQAKTNLAIGELRLSVMRLAEEIALQHSYDGRITRLEEAVFGNAPKP